MNRLIVRVGLATFTGISVLSAVQKEHDKFKPDQLKSNKGIIDAPSIAPFMGGTSFAVTLINPLFGVLFWGTTVATSKIR